MSDNKNIPTREQVDKLKSDWMKDPCWDIEDTDGFEHYFEELKLFRQKEEAAEEEAYQKYRIKINPNAPAFPFVEPNAQCNVNTGLSIRLEFAKVAMQAILSNANYLNWDSYEHMAKDAVNAADAMINELNK